MKNCGTIRISKIKTMKPLNPYFSFSLPQPPSPKNPVVVHDFQRSIWPSPPYGKTTKRHPPLAATAYKFPSPMRALTLLAALLVACYCCAWLLAGSPRCWQRVLRAARYRPLRYRPLRVQRALAGSMCCWPRAVCCWFVAAVSSKFSQFTSN